MHLLFRRRMAERLIALCHCLSLSPAAICSFSGAPTTVYFHTSGKICVEPTQESDLCSAVPFSQALKIFPKVVLWWVKIEEVGSSNPTSLFQQSRCWDWPKRFVFQINFLYLVVIASSISEYLSYLVSLLLAFLKDLLLQLARLEFPLICYGHMEHFHNLAIVNWVAVYMCNHYVMTVIILKRYSEEIWMGQMEFLFLLL